jgi:hypothetical protein
LDGEVVRPARNRRHAMRVQAIQRARRTGAVPVAAARWIWLRCGNSFPCSPRGLRHSRDSHHVGLRTREQSERHVGSARILRSRPLCAGISSAARTRRAPRCSVRSMVKVSCRRHEFVQISGRWCGE